MTQTILVVDDETNLRAMLRVYLEQEGYRVVEAADGRAALYVARVEKPDLVVLDLMMPEMNGTEFMRAFGKEAETPVIMLTAKVEDTDKILGLEVGADDYVTKPFNVRELVARVRAVLRRTEPPAERGQPRQGMPGLVLDDVHWRASLEGTPLNLTRREFGLLQVLSRHPGRIFSRARLLELAYDDTMDVTERAIDSHVKNLRRKLGAVTPAHDWIRSVYGVGFAWEAPGPG
jgi:two-component system, OmpR family, response regulator BaeR